MIQSLTKNWYLLGFCGVLEAICSAIYLVMYDASPDAVRSQEWNAEVVLLSRLLVVAGICVIAAGMWRSTKGVSWLLVINGVASSAYGLIPLLWRGPLSFRLFALLVVLMAMSFGVFVLAAARTMWNGLAGAVSVGFALAFFALVNGWIQLERRPFHPAVFLWLCFFFGFSAIGMLWLAHGVRAGITPDPAPATASS